MLCFPFKQRDLKESELNKLTLNKMNNFLILHFIRKRVVFTFLNYCVKPDIFALKVCFL